MELFQYHDLQALKEDIPPDFYQHQDIGYALFNGKQLVLLRQKIVIAILKHLICLTKYNDDIMHINHVNQVFRFGVFKTLMYQDIPFLSSDCQLVKTIITDWLDCLENQIDLIHLEKLFTSEIEQHDEHVLTHLEFVKLLLAHTLNFMLTIYANNLEPSNSNHDDNHQAIEKLIHIINNPNVFLMYIRRRCKQDVSNVDAQMIC